jgi:hypothetical protein
MLSSQETDAYYLKSEHSIGVEIVFDLLKSGERIDQNCSNPTQVRNKFMSDDLITAVFFGKDSGGQFQSGSTGGLDIMDAIKQSSPIDWGRSRMVILSKGDVNRPRRGVEQIVHLEWDQAKVLQCLQKHLEAREELVNAVKIVRRVDVEDDVEIYTLRDKRSDLLEWED